MKLKKGAHVGYRDAAAVLPMGNLFGADRPEQFRHQYSDRTLGIRWRTVLECEEYTQPDKEKEVGGKG
jgi:hypothetical protein